MEKQKISHLCLSSHGEAALEHLETVLDHLSLGQLSRGQDLVVGWSLLLGLLLLLLLPLLIVPVLLLRGLLLGVGVVVAGIHHRRTGVSGLGLDEVRQTSAEIFQIFY